MRTHLATLGLAAAWLCGCGNPTSPGPNLRVGVTVTGVDEDPESPPVLLVGDLRRSVTGRDVLYQFLLGAGTYDVRIQGLPPNCAVQGAASTSVTLQPGLPAQVNFQIECRAVTGVIAVLTPSTGRDFPASYSVSVTPPTGPSWDASVTPNAATAVTGLAPGQYELRLSASAPNCAVTGEDTRTVSVTVGGLVRDTTWVDFAVACQATTGDVLLSVTTTGSSLDPDGYTVRVDGVLVEVTSCGDYYGYPYCDQVPLRLPLNRSQLLERLAPGDHTIELTDVAATCAVEAPHPRTVSVSLGVVSEVALRVVCGAP